MFTTEDIDSMLATFDDPNYKLPSVEYLQRIASDFLQNMKEEEIKKENEKITKILLEKYTFW